MLLKSLFPDHYPQGEVPIQWMTESKSMFWHISQDLREAIILSLEFVTVIVYNKNCSSEQVKVGDDSSDASEDETLEEDGTDCWTKMEALFLSFFALWVISASSDE